MRCHFENKIRMNHYVLLVNEPRLTGDLSSSGYFEHFFALDLWNTSLMWQVKVKARLITCEM